MLALLEPAFKTCGVISTLKRIFSSSKWFSKYIILQSCFIASVYKQVVKEKLGAEESVNRVTGD